MASFCWCMQSVTRRGVWAADRRLSEHLLPNVSALGAQLGKENDVADARSVGQQHHQAVDAEAGAGGRRHAVLERPDVVGVVIHRLLVAGVLAPRLLEEARRLVLGVVQL